jgi:hypothetical protein
MYLKGTILLYESYLRILLVCFVGTARSSGVVRVNGRTVIVLPLPVAWSLALDNSSEIRNNDLIIHRHKNFSQTHITIITLLFKLKEEETTTILR